MDAYSVRTLCWLREAQIPLVQAVAAQIGLHIVAAGTEERGRAAAIASELGPDVRAEHDLRAAVSTTDAALILLADPGDFGELPADAAAIASARARGTAVCSLEPIPPSMAAIGASEWTQSLEGSPLHFHMINAASPQSNTPIVEALHAMESFGQATALALGVTAGPDAGSLGARIFAAMDLLFLFAGQPELISASIAQPRGLRSPRLDRLAQTHGMLTASVRFADHRAATILASNQSNPWHHGLTILGASGRMRIWDEGFVWTDPRGQVVDEHRVEAATVTNPAAASLAERIRRALHTPTPCAHHATVLAMAETALLSARTGNAESPATLLRLAGSPQV